MKNLCRKLNDFVVIPSMVIVGCFFLMLGAMSITGCKTVMNDGGFSDEEYLWEKWNVSTNTISIIEVDF